MLSAWVPKKTEMLVAEVIILMCGFGGILLNVPGLHKILAVDLFYWPSFP